MLIHTRHKHFFWISSPRRQAFFHRNHVEKRILWSASSEAAICVTLLWYCHVLSTPLLYAEGPEMQRTPPRRPPSLFYASGSLRRYDNLHHSVTWWWSLEKCNYGPSLWAHVKQWRASTTSGMELVQQNMARHLHHLPVVMTSNWWGRNRKKYQLEIVFLRMLMITLISICQRREIS